MISDTSLQPNETRLFAGEDDYQGLRYLLTDIYTRQGPYVSCTLGEMDWWRFTEHDQNAMSSMRLWLVGGEIRGAAWPHADSVDIFVHPDNRNLEDQMLEWAEIATRDSLPHDEGVQFSAMGYVRDDFRIALLTSRGYRRTERFFYCRVKSLSTPTPPMKLPRKFSFKHVSGEQDLQKRVDIHREAFAPSSMTVERYRRVTQAPSYRPELDLVIVAPDGTFIAQCLSWYDPVNRVGSIQPIGVHPAYRRKGFGKLICFETIRRLQDMGAFRAQVIGWGGKWTRGEPAAMLFDRVGIMETGRDYVWTKVL